MLQQLNLTSSRPGSVTVVIRDVQGSACDVILPPTAPLRLPQSQRQGSAPAELGACEVHGNGGKNSRGQWIGEPPPFDQAVEPHVNAVNAVILQNS